MIRAGTNASPFVQVKNNSKACAYLLWPIWNIRYTVDVFSDREDIEYENTIA